jgi:pilus assembly protein CpaC
MYAKHFARRLPVRPVAVVSIVTCALAIGICHSARATTADYQSPDLMFKLSGGNEKLELTTNSSRILTLDKNIPRVQVNNPDLLAVTPLSANQIQISAKKAGVTQVNLWDEDGQIHTVDILIYGDVKELEVALQTQYPNSSIKVYRYSESLVLKGFTDQPEHVSQIVQLASDYAPKIINNITVGGVAQVLLKVRVMEVSRTKLRQLGVDWAWFGKGGDYAINRVGGLISAYSSIDKTFTSQGDTFSFGIVGNNSGFFGVLDALEQRNCAKVLAEPNLVAVSGRPAQFNVGGEFPILVPQSLGTTSIEFKKYGTQVDFLPLVLGNGSLRLEVRPRVSSLDPTTAVVIPGTGGISVPGLIVREVDTAVEMKAGQTFALAGLVQERTDTINRGLPYLSDMPIIGVPFRRTRDEVNEIELLIMVTPEFVDAIEPHEVPCGGPGYATTSPTNCQLYCAGHVEVPVHCNPISGMTACGECGGGPCGGCGNVGGSCGCGPQGPVDSIISDGVQMQGGTGYDDAGGPTPMPMPSPAPNQFNTTPVEPEGMTLPPAAESEPLPPQASQTSPAAASRLANTGGSPQYTVPRPYSQSRQPVFVRNAVNPDNPTAPSAPATEAAGSGGLIGPVGYDAE